MTSVPFSEACERNKGPILNVLRRCFEQTRSVIEIGSGTGQHAVHFSTELPHLHWQPTDTGDYLEGLRRQVAAANLPNVAAPVELDVRMEPWPVGGGDAIFSANTLHYMSELCVEAFFNGVGRALAENGILVVYGPFRYRGRYTSPSNERFDAWLKEGDPERGVRDFEWVDSLASAQGLRLDFDAPMPANNQCLVWRQITEA